MNVEREAWWVGLLAAAPVAVWMLARDASGLGAGGPSGGPLADGARALWVVQALVLTLLPGPGPGARPFRRGLMLYGAVLVAGLPVVSVPWATGVLGGGTLLRAIGGLFGYGVLLSAAGVAGYRWCLDQAPLGRDLTQGARLICAAGLWAWRGTWLPWLG